jgi:hypothetical protein
VLQVKWLERLLDVSLNSSSGAIMNKRVVWIVLLKPTFSEEEKPVLHAEEYKKSKLSLSYMAHHTFSSGIH